MKGTLRRLAGYGLALAALFFLGRVLVQTWGDVAASGYVLTFRLPELVASLLLLVIGRLFAVEAWRRILLALGERLGFVAAVQVWFLSNLARYVPGNIWQIAAMVSLVEAEGVGKANAVLAQAMYMVIALCIAGLAGVMLLLADPHIVPGLPVGEPATAAAWAIAAAVAFGLLLLLLALPPVYRLTAAVMGRVARRQVAAPALTLGYGLLPPLFSAVMWVAQGVAFYVFAGSVTDTTPDMLPGLVAMNAAAYLIGYISFITPSGLGFREGALALMLARYFPAPLAVALSLLARLWSTAGELLGGVFLLWPRLRTDRHVADGRSRADG